MPAKTKKRTVTRTLDSYKGRRSSSSKAPAKKTAAKKTATKKEPHTRRGGGYGKGGPITSVSKFYGDHTVVVQDYKKNR